MVAEPYLIDAHPISPEDAALLYDKIYLHASPNLFTGCHVIDKYLNADGYVHIKKMTRGKQRGYMGHRVVWTHMRGPVPEGMTLDHLCGTRNCVNPDHLEVVHQSENTRRAFAKQKKCKRGHDLPPAEPGRRRLCKECRRLYNRALTPPPPGDERHGKYTTYTNYKCRCDLCSQAYSEWYKAYYRRRKQAEAVSSDGA